MKISVNILCWNTLRTLKMTMDILRDELKDIEHEIVVVDNGSNDGLHDYLAGLVWINSGRIKKVFNAGNYGISVGKNQGIRVSEGEYILLLDGDVVPVPNSIIKMIEFLDNNPDKFAIGMYPNKFAIEPNKHSDDKHESWCEKLFQPVPSQTACLFYGLYCRSVFDDCMMDESGEYGKPGYGWEDHDFFMQMREKNIIQWVAHMNHAGGKYYHAINSSIRQNCLGYDVYMETSQTRARQYHSKWDKVPCQTG